jgi:hypothetical protein
MSMIELEGVLDGLGKEDLDKIPKCATGNRSCIAIENDVAYGDLRYGSIALLSDLVIVFKRERMTAIRKII